MNLSSNHIGDEGVQVRKCGLRWSGYWFCCLSWCESAPSGLWQQACTADAQHHHSSRLPIVLACRVMRAVLCHALLHGVQALVDVLQQGGCSELISLDLRGNSLSPQAEALLVRAHVCLEPH